MAKTTHVELGRYLEVAAQEQRLVTYSEVLKDHRDLPPLKGGGNPLFKLLGQLDEEDLKYRRPLRSSIVVRKDTRTPGDGFFAMFQKSRVPKMLSSEREEYWKAEVRDVFSYYRQS